MQTITVKKEMSFTDLFNNSWSGAIDTLRTISDNDKEEELMSLLYQIFEDNATETEVNDYLWFNSEEIFQLLDINEDEDSDSEE